MRERARGGISFCDRWLYLLVACAVVSVFYFDRSMLRSVEEHVFKFSTEETGSSRITSTAGDSSPPVPSSTCIGYREYPFPEHHSGLPYLADAFASFDASTVTFVGINRGKCDEEWKEADSFASFHVEQYHRFLCVFRGISDASNDEEVVYVLSDYIESTWPHDPVYLIQCQLPEVFRHLITPGQTLTNLHVDLRSLEDMEQDKGGSWGNHRRRNPPRSMSDGDEDSDSDAGYRSSASLALDVLPSISNIPICHPESVHVSKFSKRNSQHPDDSSHLQPNQFRLVGFLPITSSYAIDSREGAEDSTVWSSSAQRLPEWIDYHRMQGYDHFVIYDNDPLPNGPIYQILINEGHIDSGLVSYRWFPLKNCMSSVEHRRMDTAQVSGSMAALHRIGFSTEFFSYHDGDEYLVPLRASKRKSESPSRATILELAEDIFEAKPEIDAIEWVPTVMAPCNGTVVEAGGSVVAKWQCLTDQHYADVKLIVRTATIFYFCIHYPVVRKYTKERGDTSPEAYRLDDTTEGYLAHYRAENDPNGSWRDDYAGLVSNEWTDRIDYMDGFLASRGVEGFPRTSQSSASGIGEKPKTKPKTKPKPDRKPKKKKKKKKEKNIEAESEKSLTAKTKPERRDGTISEE